MIGNLKRKILYGVIRYRIADCMCKIVNVVLKCIFLLPRLLRLESVKKFEENVLKKNNNLFCRVFKSYGLICALEERNIEVASKLIDKGANLNVWNGRSTPLMYACYGGMESIANKLIEKGADINCANIYGDTPLLFACSNGMESIANKLIEKGVDISCANICGDTPLLFACDKGMKSTVKMLIDRGVNIDTELENASKVGMCDVVNKVVNEVNYFSENDIRINETDQSTLSIECVNNTSGFGMSFK